MKRSWAIIIFGILILIAVVFYSLSNRYYVSGNYMIDRFTGKSRFVRDTIEETPTPLRTPWTADDVRKARGELED
jgi:hypothetical protein